MTKVYSIHGQYKGITDSKLNCRLDEKGKVKGIYYSAIAQAVRGGTIYFIDIRTAKKYLANIVTKDWKSPKIQECKLTRDDLYKVGRGLYISKNTYYYKKLKTDETNSSSN